jgi:hypothetical protein
MTRAHEVEAYLGLVPREVSSGESQRRGWITTAGNTRMRWVLVQAAVSILRLRDPRTAALRCWATGIADCRGTCRTRRPRRPLPSEGRQRGANANMADLQSDAIHDAMLSDTPLAGSTSG